jgi:hypothetical protein
MNDLLRHVVFAEIGEKLITDDGVHSLEMFSGGGLLVLRSGGGCDYRKRGNDGSGGCSDGSRCGEDL